VNKSLLGIITFSVLLLVPGGLQAVYAGPVTTCETVASGNWNSGTTWDSSPDGTCNVVINSGHTVTITSPVSDFASITIAIGGALIVDGPNGGILNILANVVGTNNGQMTMNGGDSFNIGSFRNQGSFTNTCSGDMVFNGGTAGATGSFFNDGGTAANSGIMTFNGGIASFSGTLNQQGSFTNHNTINFVAGGGPNAGVLNGQITEDPELCPMVAGELLPIDSTTLLVAGAQMNAVWIIPLIVAAAAIGIVVSRKS